MKIAFIACNTWAPWGGSEELWGQAAGRCRARGDEVLACVPQWPAPVPQVEALRAAGCRIHFVGLRRRSGWERLVHAWRGFPRPPPQEAAMQEAVAPFAPELVVISQGNNHDGLAWANACHRRGLRYVLVAQAALPSLWPDDTALDALRGAYRDAAAAWFVADANRRLTEEQLALALPHAAVVWNPFSVSYQQIPTWPESHGGWRLAQVGRLEPGAKGQDLLFHVLAQAKWRERPLRVSLFGGGHSSRLVRELAAYHRLEHVDFPGATGDIAGIWRTHHALVLPSRHEGLPLTLVEAALCHRPAIVTDVGGNAEFVREGETGFIAESATVAALDRALERAWSARERWRDMGLAAGRQARALVPEDPVGEFVGRLTALARRA